MMPTHLPVRVGFQGPQLRHRGSYWEDTGETAQRFKGRVYTGLLKNCAWRWKLIENSVS